MNNPEVAQKLSLEVMKDVMEDRDGVVTSGDDDDGSSTNNSSSLHTSDQADDDDDNGESITTTTVTSTNPSRIVTKRKICITTESIVRDKRRKVVCNKTITRSYGFVFDKGVIMSDTKVLPFGHRDTVGMGI